MATGRPFHRKLIKFISNDTPVFHRGYKINVGKESKEDKYQDCYVDITDKVIDHLAAERKRFHEVFIGRFELYLAKDFEDRQADMVTQRKMITSFLSYAKTYLGKKTVDKNLPLRNHSPVKIGWCREYGSEKGWHYHCYIVLNAQKVDCWDKSGLFDLLDNLWHKCAQYHCGSLHINDSNLRKGNKNHFIITPNPKGDEQLKQAIYALSYLAKVRDKRDNNSVPHIATHSIPKIDTLAKARERFRNSVMND